MNTGIDTDVLIVGAGPVGLFLANECARRGLRWRIVEEHRTQSEHSKALAIFPRTLEIFDMAGIVTPFLQKANPVTQVTIATREHKLAQMKFKTEESPYSFIAMVPQDVTERLLVEELQRKGRSVEYETKFIGAEQQGDSVSVTLDHKSQPLRLKTLFVVGCDGAHSAVRHQLNLPFEGAEYNGLFILADIEMNDAFPANEVQLWPSEFGPVAIFPISATRWRVVAVIDQQDGDAPSLELVQRILAARAPSGIEARSLHWSSYFHIHHRLVGRLREGHMFIAGDAAHIHSPFGGQGMNTGLHDVWNLAWKLDFFLRGHGNEQLLDSYSAERLPVIRNVVETTHLMTKALATPSKFAQVLRDAIIPIVSHLAPFEHAFLQRLSELGIAYHGSPIVEGSGKRYFDDSLRGGNGIVSRFLLVLNSAAGPPIQQAAQQLVDSFSDVVELRQTRHDGVTLVRPDGYIAYSSDSTDAKVFDEVRSVLQRQTTQAPSAEQVA